ncbi:MAG: DUF4976 domain-containing protein [Planctomycetota bacterium]|mgnify:CR=1 FL=1|nr:MAG: DUF4976 domain-containing protein [Planctomycetota bacterium]
MTSGRFLGFAFAAALISFCGTKAVAQAPAADERPNILYIYTDDQSRRAVSCYEQAQPWVRTPNIDRLARDGTRFRSAYIGTWCMPSRASQLTGHLQFAIESMRMEGSYPGSTYDPKLCPFWPRTLREHGYVTAQIGKWHTGRDTGYGRDWDLQAVWNRPNLKGDDVNAYYFDQKMEVNGAPARQLDGYSTDNYTDFAVDFIRNRRIGQNGADRTRPWFLWLCYAGVHGPYTPAPRHLEEYPGSRAEVPVDIFPPRPNKPPHLRARTRWKRDEDGSPVGFQKAVRKYHQAVCSLDEGVGRLLEALRETGQLDNTLIVFTSDQGFAWGQHGLREKWAPYDAALCAPLIFHLPGRVASGAVCDVPVGGVDIVPTLLAMAGVEEPWTMHGHDLSPLLSDAGADWAHPVLLPQTHDFYGSDLNPLPPEDRRWRRELPWYVLLRRGSYKYVRYLVDGEGDELYDLAADPDELSNLASDPAHQQTVADMREAMNNELQRTGPEFLQATGW